jgi:predicted nucleic acid-binding protein
MTVLDAYGLVAFLVGGRAAEQVAAILRTGEASVPTANLAEALDVSERVRGMPIGRAMEILEPLFEGALATIPLDRAIALRAAEIRVRHYHRTACPISLADAVLVASAGSGSRLATADAAVLAVARAEGIASIELP